MSERALLLLQNLMRSVGLSLEQVMTALDVPEAERAADVEPLENQ